MVSTSKITPRRSLPSKDGGLVTVAFLYAEREAGRAWELWLGDGTRSTVDPWFGGDGWTDADGFLDASTRDWPASLADAPSGLVVMARPKPDVD